MAIYGIYACENMYCGLHGMNNYGFEDCDDDEMANAVGTESVPGVVVDDAITIIQEAGYKTNRKAKALTVLWDKATEPVS